ncbi:MAG: hypothetical protein JNL83_31905 [Myxococcales bacterium]|nr:hypothetical protein [Myxococcales bacterium]
MTHMKLTTITTLFVLVGLTAAAAAQPGAGAARALVIHAPPLSAPVGHPVELEAMIDAPFAETLTSRWRAIGEPTWHDVPFERSSAGGWYATLPPVAPPGLEYYIVGVDASGAQVAHFASEQAPHRVRVDPELFDRLEELDRRRHLGLRDQISVDFMGHNFGNRYDLPDKFFRGEATFTHRLWRMLHSISFGFGTIWGQTPRSSEPDDHMQGYLNTGSRYGFGEVRVRVHPSVFVDARAQLAVTHDGFDGGVRGQIIFGKPWRSSLFIGGEALGDLGKTAWVRLQWDTAAPLLMGASIVRTNLPGVVISSAGLYIAYDVAYTIAQRYTFKAQLSYGARDGASHVGGGLATAVDF